MADAERHSFGGGCPEGIKLHLSCPEGIPSGKTGLGRGMYFAYIIKSIKDGKYYYGHTHNIEKRLLKHNKKTVRSTKARSPFTLHYQEEFNTKQEAAKREYFFKTIDGYNYLKEKEII